MKNILVILFLIVGLNSYGSEINSDKEVELSQIEVENLEETVEEEILVIDLF